MDISELKRLNLSVSINRHPWELVRSKIVYKLLKSRSSSFDTVVDFGSGDIFVLHELEQKKIARHYHAVDNAYSESLIQSLQKQYPNSAITFNYSIDNVKEKTSHADCFLFLDVIEHCENDIEILQSVIATNFADKNAVILVTVPAFQSLFSEHDKLLNHFRRYNIKQLSFVCQQAGLKVSTSGYFFFSLLLARSIQSLLQKFRPRKISKSLDNWRKGKFITTTITFCLWLDFNISYLLNKAGIKLPGLSCYCICSKE